MILSVVRIMAVPNTVAAPRSGFDDQSLILSGVRVTAVLVILSVVRAMAVFTGQSGVRAMPVLVAGQWQFW